MASSSGSPASQRDRGSPNSNNGNDRAPQRHVVRFSENDNFRRNAPKLVVCGEPGVGKTSVVRQMEHRLFSQHDTRTTTGMEFHAITTPDGHQLQVWDLAGQMRASANNHANFRNAAGILVCGAVTDPDTIERMRHWLREIRVTWKTQYGATLPDDTPEGHRTPMPVRTFLVFNKIDLKDLSAEEERQLRSLVDAYGCHGCFFTTATEFDNVAAMFEQVASDLTANAPRPPTPPPEAKPAEKSDSRCCGGGGAGSSNKKAAGLQPKIVRQQPKSR